MKNWNKIGKIKSSVILILCVLALILFDYNEEQESQMDFHFGITILTFLFIVLFFPIITKFWSLFGFKFEKPSWNESPISFKFSKSFNFFQFMAFWFISSGLVNALAIGVLNQRFDGKSVHLFFAGIGILIGIKLSLKWMNQE